MKKIASLIEPFVIGFIAALVFSPLLDKVSHAIISVISHGVIK
jgi:hypothetical protein